MRSSIITFATLIACINALKITSPSAGQTLDPTQPITVTWTSDSSDPATVDILASDPNGFISETRVGRDVQTSSGSFIVPANSIQSYGTGFVIKVDSSNGQHLATSPPFDLSMGFGADVNGQPGLVQSQTYTGSPAITRAASSGSSSGSSAAAVVTGSSASTNSAAASVITGSAGESTILSGSRTGFSTSTMSGTSRSTSTTRSASSTSASSASATTSANAQPRLASGSQIVLSGAGLIAGLAALLA